MDFTSMTGPQLVAAWNEMLLTAHDLNCEEFKPVKRFADAATGRKRCAHLHGLIQEKAKSMSKAPEETESDIPDFLKRTETPEQAENRRMKYAKRNKPDDHGLKVVEPFVTPEKIRKAIAKDLAETDEEKANPSQELNPPSKKDESVMAKKTKKRATNGSGKHILANDSVITKLQKQNVGRKGTYSHDLFEKIKSGMTVADWKKVAKERAGNYLRWYISHGMVKVS